MNQEPCTNIRSLEVDLGCKIDRFLLQFPDYSQNHHMHISCSQLAIHFNGLNLFKINICYHRLKIKQKMEKGQTANMPKVHSNPKIIVCVPAYNEARNITSV